MTDLIATLRRLTGAGPTEYRIGADTYWTDEQLQDVIDARVSARLIQAQVELIGSIDDEGRTVFVNGRVRFPGTLDTATATVVDTGGQAISGATIHDDGRVEFAADQVSTTPLLSGLAYDLYGAGADVLTSWASAVKGGVDIAEDGQSFKRSQGHQQISAQAAALRAKAVVGTVSLSRSDLRGRRRHGGSPRTSAVVKSFRRWGLNG